MGNPNLKGADQPKPSTLRILRFVGDVGMNFWVMQSAAQ
jgi:hypothetical protein